MRILCGKVGERFAKAVTEVLKFSVLMMTQWRAAVRKNVSLDQTIKTYSSMFSLRSLFCRLNDPKLPADVRLRFAMSASNRFSEHYGLSVASIDKIEDGSTSCGYRIYLPKYREFLARFEADPGGFYLTFNMAQQMGNIQLSILFDNVSLASTPENLEEIQKTAFALPYSPEKHCLLM